MHDSAGDRDPELVGRALDDPEAFQELYHRYFRRVYGYVAARIDNPHDAEDVVSEIFISVIRNLRDVRNQRDSSFAAWLFVIARNAVASYYRRDGRSAALVHLDEAAPLAATGPEPERVISADEQAALLRGLLATLPDRWREMVTLRYYGGLRNHEIASVLGIGEKTVSAYLNRALNRLHEQYTAFHAREEQRSGDA